MEGLRSVTERYCWVTKIGGMELRVGGRKGRLSKQIPWVGPEKFFQGHTVAP